VEEDNDSPSGHKIALVLRSRPESFCGGVAIGASAKRVNQPAIKWRWDHIWPMTAAIVRGIRFSCVSFASSLSPYPASLSQC